MTAWHVKARRPSRQLLLPFFNQSHAEPSAFASACLRFVPLLVLVVLVLALVPMSLSRPPLAPLPLAQDWQLQHSLHSGTAFLYASNTTSALQSPRPVLRTGTQHFMNQDCADEWVAHGRLCSVLRKGSAKLDLVFTWGNGSSFDRPMADWRQAMASLEANTQRAGPDAVARHFREHDELKYALRAVVEAIGSDRIRRVHLVVGDSPASLPSQADPQQERLVQIPNFVNLDSDKLVVHPHSSIFKVVADNDNEALSWRNQNLPTFNSLAIESQLANIPDLAENVLVLNDDMFLLTPLSRADISSPLYGPVFRLSRSTLVYGDTNPTDDPDGEWRGLKITNAVLDARFGRRPRPYVAHQGKSYSKALLEEVQTVFGEELTKTAESTFRGSKQFEVQMAFLFTHYVIEKHREALLWSFFVAKSDADHDGKLSLDQRKSLLNDIGYDGSSPIIKSAVPVRSSIDRVAANLGDASLAAPLATDYVFSSMDGYAHFHTDDDLPHSKPFLNFQAGTLPEPSAPHCTLDVGTCFGGIQPLCTIDVRTCFTEQFLDADSEISTIAALQRVAFEVPRCGDCIIVQLLARSGEVGLDAFLPASPPNIASDADDSQECQLGWSAGWETASFDHDKCKPDRSTAVNLIRRYSHVIGDTSSKLYRLTGPRSLRRALNHVDRTEKAFATFNDDMGDSLDKQKADAFDTDWRQWLEKRWPSRAPWEK